MDDYRKYLQPDTIARLKNIELKARMVVEGFITGLHKSPYHGFSVEFAEHRPYNPGDPIRYLDWKVYGRSDKFYIKQFEEETNLRSVIALDSSASMKYASKGNISKYEYSSYLAAAISYLLIKQRDAAGLALYDTDIKRYLPPNSRQSFISEILKAIAGNEPENETGTAKALDLLAERINRRGLVVIISDFFDETDSIMQALKHFRHKKHEVIVFQVLDPREVDFKLGSGANFRDMETGEEMITQPHQLRKVYHETMQDFIETIKSACYANHIDYHLIDTSMPFDRAMKEFIIKRSRV